MNINTDTPEIRDRIENLRVTVRYAEIIDEDIQRYEPVAGEPLPTNPVNDMMYERLIKNREIIRKQIIQAAHALLHTLDHPSRAAEQAPRSDSEASTPSPNPQNQGDHQ